MKYASFESLMAKVGQVQILDPNMDADSQVAEFLKDKENVSTASEAMQKKIRRAVTPFWQERYVSMHGEEALHVSDLMTSPKFFLQTEHYVDDTPFPATDPSKLDEAFEIAGLSKNMLERKLMSLSNGELRRILLARIWMENPKWAYFNDPFGGLDPEYRARLARTIVNFADTGLNVVVRLIREDELLPKIPAFVFENGEFVEYAKPLPEKCPDVESNEVKTYEFENLGEADAERGKEILFDLKNVCVKFGDTEIIKNLTWQVRAGEHWVVMGPNGAGKSTLLAMLSADHPQMYNNDMVLLGERPGHGLNIWEHKDKIGFFSPELALHYKEDLTLMQVLCTGYSSSLAVVREPLWNEKERARNWLKEFGFDDPNASFNSLSASDKRIVLIARAAIKPPKVLILDEPTQGLDAAPREKLFDLLQFLSGVTSIIFVSHYDEWPSCMNRMLRMPRIQ